MSKNITHIKDINSVDDFERIFKSNFKSDDFYPSKSWSMGGSSGASCWDNSPSEGYPGESDPDPEMSSRVMEIMCAFWPDMTLSQYKEFKEENDFMKEIFSSDSDFYGNYSSRMSVYGSFKDFYYFSRKCIYGDEKMKFIVFENKEAWDEYNMDACSLDLYNESDVDKVKGIVFKDTRECVGYLPVFYFDNDGYICGFEGWGGDEEVLGVVKDDVDLSNDIIEIENF